MRLPSADIGSLPSAVSSPNSPGAAGASSPYGEVGEFQDPVIARSTPISPAVAACSRASSRAIWGSGLSAGPSMP